MKRRCRVLGPEVLLDELHSCEREKARHIARDEATSFHAHCVRLVYYEDTAPGCALRGAVGVL